MKARLFFLLSLAIAGWGTPASARAEVVISTEASDVGVTVYRDPRRSSGQMEARWPRGYAVITETRTVTLPAGESQIRFENVAEGMMPETAIITGLPKGVREKNRDARLISPAGLVDAYLKRRVRIRRTNLATGKVTDQEAIIQAGPNGGVVLETKDGVEALRCSGLPERMTFNGLPDTLTARPTLSVLTRNDTPVTATLQLTYMAQGFDWSANYIATLGADKTKMGLFAWLTVANGGAQSFKNARLQVVGGKPEKKRNNPPPPPPSSWLNLQCWPMDITSTHPTKYWSPLPLPPARDLTQIGRNRGGTYRPRPKKEKRRRAKNGDITVTAQLRKNVSMEVPLAVSVVPSDYMVPAPPPLPTMAAPVPAEGAMAEQEELGDLKLYRIPMRVTVAAQSQKQVAMLNKTQAAFRRIYRVVGRHDQMVARPVTMMLAARNLKEQGLGLALPAGSVAMFETVADRPMLIDETDIDDLAIGQDVEFSMGQSNDVWSTLTRMPDESGKQAWRWSITNARPFAIRAELIVPLNLIPDGVTLERSANGWIMPINVPANSVAAREYRLKPS